jgi:hypothetical protein
LHNSKWHSSWGWALLALGAASCILAKLTSALALLAVVITAFFLSVRGWRELPWKGILVCTSTLAGSLLLVAIVADGSPLAFVQRFAAGSEEVRLLDAGQSISLLTFFSRLQPTDRWKTLVLLAVLAAGVALLTRRSALGQPFPPRTTAWLSAILIASLVWSLLPLWNVAPPPLRLRRLEGGFLAVPIGVCLGAVLALRGPRRFPGARDTFCLVAVLLAMPFVYAFGTNMDLWLTSGNAAYFWFLPGILLVKERVACILYLLLTQVLAVLAVGLYLHEPYRQSQSLLAPKIAVDFPAHGGVALALTPDAADYARSLVRLAEQVELRERTPLLDLTGNSPGTQYFLGTKPVGSAWIIGGFPGSEAYASALLARVSCEELAAAWVLVQPQGRRSVPIRLLALHGILQDHLEPVGMVSAPEREIPVRHTQVLYRPVRPVAEAVTACEAARMGRRAD